jgi:4-amino-4-deoxy-L-arabinose transferase-like glycosyltransferase
MRRQLNNKYFLANYKLIGVLLIIFAVHLPLILNDFHTDDFMVLEIVRKGISSDGLTWMENPANFRPLVNLVIYVRYWFFDEVAGLWYLLNILLHLLATALLYKFAKRLYDDSTAVLAALFFGIYFQHFEAVLWLYGIVRLLAGVCVLLTLYHYNEAIRGFKRENILASYLCFGLGLLCVEDVVCLSIFLFAGIWLYEIREKKRLALYGIGFIGITVLYLLIRLILGNSDGSAASYFGFGKHVLTNIVAYPGWLLIPSFDHPYIAPFIKPHFPGIVPYLKSLDLFISAVAFSIIIYLFIKGDKIQKKILVFTLISLIPAIFFSRKISTKLSYIPSIGVAILAASMIKPAINKANMFARKSIYAILIIYIMGQAAATVLTINYYRITQATVTNLLGQLDSLHIDWARYEYMLFDQVPGRARLGSAFHFRHGFAPHLIEKCQHAEDPPDLEKEKNRLRENGISFIEIDFSKGYPVIVESNPE